jgi:hypothetical protein
MHFYERACEARNRWEIALFRAADDELFGHGKSVSERGAIVPPVECA